MTDQDYERNELRLAGKHMDEVNSASLSDRKDAAESFYAAMKDDPALVAERISWMLDGNYGKGAQLKAEQVLASPRMNQAAALNMLVASFEWMCPGRMAAASWKRLTPVQKRELDEAISVVIESATGEEDPSVRAASHLTKKGLLEAASEAKSLGNYSE
jgi:hypothetical protein